MRPRVLGNCSAIIGVKWGANAMVSAAKDLIKRILKRFDVGIATYSRLQRLEWLSNAGDTVDFLLRVPDDHVAQLLKALRVSKSQLRQDLFVLSELNLKREGFFVEFGAANGIDLSNTYVLEKEFGWRGIVAEPARCWHSALLSNRSCHIETGCVWRESNSILTFNEVEAGELSTVDSCSSSDSHSRVRRKGKGYSVTTISLEDMLDKYGAPMIIDYLSIDTEGSEYEILKSFEFSRYQFRLITCEHNFSPQREKIFHLLTKNGYLRRYERYSGCDDWYVKAGLD